MLAPGVNVDRLTTMVMCITYGFLFGARTNPTAVSEPLSWSGSEVTLPALAVEAVVAYVTSATSPRQRSDPPAG